MPLRKNSVDMTITSPPYANAIDYLRCSKFSLVWMGFTVSELRCIRGESIGTQRGLDRDVWNSDLEKSYNKLGDVAQLPNSTVNSLKLYLHDMNKSVQEIARVTRTGGKIFWVIGDSTMRGIFVKNSNAIASLCRNAGIEVTKRRTRVIPESRRYLPPPKKGSPNAIEKRMRKEVILECVNGV